MVKIKNSSGKDALIVLSGRIKGQSVILDIYPAKSGVKTRKLAKIKDYHKNERLVSIHFPTISSIDRWIEALTNMRDYQIYTIGKTIGESEAKTNAVVKVVKKGLKPESVK